MLLCLLPDSSNWVQVYCAANDPFIHRRKFTCTDYNFTFIFSFFIGGNSLVQITALLSLSQSFFTVRGLWFMVHDSWFMVRGLWFGVYGSGFMVHGLWFTAYGSWLMVYGLWSTVCGLRFMVCGAWFFIYLLFFRSKEVPLL
jgi:hypothetical protein